MTVDGVLGAVVAAFVLVVGVFVAIGYVLDLISLPFAAAREVEETTRRPERLAFGCLDLVQIVLWVIGGIVGAVATALLLFGLIGLDPVRYSYLGGVIFFGWLALASIGALLTHRFLRRRF